MKAVASLLLLLAVFSFAKASCAWDTIDTTYANDNLSSGTCPNYPTWINWFTFRNYEIYSQNFPTTGRYEGLVPCGCDKSVSSVESEVTPWTHVEGTVSARYFSATTHGRVFTGSCAPANATFGPYVVATCEGNDDEETCEELGYHWNSFASPQCREASMNSGCSPNQWGYWFQAQTCQWVYANCDCLDSSETPILIDVAGNGFSLTNKANGTAFDMNGDGIAEERGWTAAGGDDAFLVLDRNGNGTIDTGAELFGNYTPQPEPPLGVKKNGFLALAELDSNHNGVVGVGDAQFSSLRLWTDANHDGVSQASELKPLMQRGIAAISTNYKESRRMDVFGNQFLYRARVLDIAGQQAGRWAWDVVFVR